MKSFVIDGKSFCDKKLEVFVDRSIHEGSLRKEPLEVGGVNYHYIDN